MVRLRLDVSSFDNLSEEEEEDDDDDDVLSFLVLFLDFVQYEPANKFDHESSLSES